MKLTCVIPVYNYIKGLNLIIEWIRKEFPSTIKEYDVIIFNDKSDSIYNKDFARLNSKPNIRVINSKVNTKNLKIPLETAANNAINKGHDAVLVIESDAIPSIDTFLKMCQVFKNPFRTPVASVSPMYKWNNRYCYPTSSHWFKDGLNSSHGRKNYSSIGTVTTVGSSGVPFLFSLWKPDVLKNINRLEFPNMVSLDSKFGESVHKKGFHHLRLLDHHVGHDGGGQKSWKTPVKKGSKSEISVKPTIKSKKKPNIVKPHSPRKTVTIEQHNQGYVFPPSETKLKTNTYVSSTKKTAVLIHLFYTDLWKEFESYLIKLNCDFDLYVNLVESTVPFKKLLKIRKEILKTYPTATVLISDNKGMDIGGTFNLLEYIFNLDIKYDLFLKIHSKKSIHSANLEHGTAWRKELIYPILDNKILAKFNSKQVGMVGSKKWHIKTRLNKRLTYMSNLKFIQYYIKLLKLRTSEDEIEFIGGTMFWIDAKIIYKYFNKELLVTIRNEFEFGKFTDHNSPSRTHAFERIFGALVIDDKKKIIGV